MTDTYRHAVSNLLYPYIYLTWPHHHLTVVYIVLYMRASATRVYIIDFNFQVPFSIYCYAPPSSIYHMDTDLVIISNNVAMCLYGSILWCIAFHLQLLSHLIEHMYSYYNLNFIVSHYKCFCVCFVGVIGGAAHGGAILKPRLYACGPLWVYIDPPLLNCGVPWVNICICMVWPDV